MIINLFSSQIRMFAPAAIQLDPKAPVVSTPLLSVLPALTSTTTGSLGQYHDTTPNLSHQEATTPQQDPLPPCPLPVELLAPQVLYSSDWLL